MNIQLGDDGTLNTVIVCTDCNKEFRYNYDVNFAPDEPDDEKAYQGFIDYAIDDVELNHNCDDPENDWC